MIRTRFVAWCMRAHVHLYLLLLLALSATGCAGGFRIENYPTPTELYSAAMEQYRLEEWENAVNALEQVTLRLPARDTLMPRAHYYLARAHTERGHHQLAAASYMRLFEAFPGDTLADDALLGAGDAYAATWRGPERDAEPALRALDAYELFERLYPTSELLPQAQAGIARMNEGLARKEYLTGMHYVRRRAYDSALIYFQSAAQEYPGTPAAREAQLAMVDVYSRLNYGPEATDLCRALRERFPGDAEVRSACAAFPADTTG